jgi:hypothetical protein
MSREEGKFTGPEQVEYDLLGLRVVCFGRRHINI